MKRIVVAISAVSLALAGCATGSSGVVTSYASPMMYGGYNCAQLAAEDEMLRAQVAELKGTVDRTATNDKVMVGVGVVLFWPALLFIKGDGEAQSQYAHIKGEHDAIQHAFLLRGCAANMGGASPSPGNVTHAAFTDATSGPMTPAGGFADGSGNYAPINRF